MAKHPKLIQRMKARREQGLTYRELGDENNMSHTHARRLINKEKKAYEFKDDKED